MQGRSLKSKSRGPPKKKTLPLRATPTEEKKFAGGEQRSQGEKRGGNKEDEHGRCVILRAQKPSAPSAGKKGSEQRVKRGAV